jgi:hypothetical protein
LKDACRARFFRRATCTALSGVSGLLVTVGVTLGGCVGFSADGGLGPAHGYAALELRVVEGRLQGAVLQEGDLYRAVGRERAPQQLLRTGRGLVTVGVTLGGCVGFSADGGLGPAHGYAALELRKDSSSGGRPVPRCRA